VLFDKKENTYKRLKSVGAKLAYYQAQIRDAHQAQLDGPFALTG
jgi:hypothetical protein